jgi:hypothetical protein
MYILIFALCIFGTYAASDATVAPAHFWSCDEADEEVDDCILDGSIIHSYTDSIRQGVAALTTPAPATTQTRNSSRWQLFQDYARKLTQYFGWDIQQTPVACAPVVPTPLTAARQLFANDVAYLQELEHTAPNRRRAIASTRMLIAHFYTLAYQEQDNSFPTSCAQILADPKLCSSRSFNEISQWYLLSGNPTDKGYELLHEPILKEMSQALSVRDIKAIVFAYANDPHSSKRDSFHDCVLTDELSYRTVVYGHNQKESNFFNRPNTIRRVTFTNWDLKTQDKVKIDYSQRHMHRTILPRTSCSLCFADRPRAASKSTTTAAAASGK